MGPWEGCCYCGICTSDEAQISSLREWGGAPIRLWDTRIIIFLHLSFSLHSWQLGKEAGQAWAHASWVRWMPGLWLWEHQPPGGNPLYTTAVAAEAGGEMRFGLLGWEALMAFPGPQWDSRGLFLRANTGDGV